MENHGFPSPGLTAGIPVPALPEKCDNIFLIDWLTVVIHGETVEYIKWLFGLDDPGIPWETSEKFRNGYPCSDYWSGITISYGADDAGYYKDPEKVRHDMGICVNLSGKGCRAFESHGHGDWWKLFRFFLRNTKQMVQERIEQAAQGGYAIPASAYSDYKKFCNITRLDLAYDDHDGLLNIKRIALDTKDRNYLSKSKKSEILWSDDQESDIQGLTVQIGSDKSDIKIRIYDKAAERGFKDRHWIRTEMQLRDDRASAASKELLLQQHVGRVCVGILRNYLTFRTPAADENKSRWPIAPYWEKLLFCMERIRLWKTPGEEYNFSRTEYFLYHQYGQSLVVLSYLNDDFESVVTKARELYSYDDLAPKYKEVLQKHWNQLRKEAEQNDDQPYQTPYQIPACSPAVDDEKEAGSASCGGLM